MRVPGRLSPLPDSSTITLPVDRKSIQIRTRRNGNNKSTCKLTEPEKEKSLTKTWFNTGYKLQRVSSSVTLPCPPVCDVQFD